MFGLFEQPAKERAQERATRRETGQVHGSHSCSKKKRVEEAGLKLGLEYF